MPVGLIVAAALSAMTSDDWIISPPPTPAAVVERAGQIHLENGLVRRSFLLAPNAACTSLENLTTGEQFLRGVRPEILLTLDGISHEVGGLKGQPVGNFLRPEWLSQLQSDPKAWRFTGWKSQPFAAPFPWKRRPDWMTRDMAWPPKGIDLVLAFQSPEQPNLRVEVIHTLFDGVPIFGKRFRLTNGSERPVKLDQYTSEFLATVEASSTVEEDAQPEFPRMHVETDFTTVSMSGEDSQRYTVKWRTDSTYTTQVSYELKTLVELVVAPPLGPAITLKTGESFESFRTYEMLLDSHDETRRSLSLNRFYRTIAPWSEENPMIMHVRSAETEAVKLAIDQSAEVGFEMVIMTFGSGFNMETTDAKELARIKDLADYAKSKGIALGGYSLLASRSVSPEDDVINPKTGKPGGFATFGHSPCIESRWGQNYMNQLKRFFRETGCEILEHDGSYPGDACASKDHPGHEGYEDSRYRQWQTITQFYQWCRGRGIHLNIPDWYFLNGANKTAMGYRETNWSLPREHQEIIERQNIHDGTRYKTPSMGWMFVPLTVYQGGGAAATIEPLKEHLPHYEQRLANLLGNGVQACFRGPRLFDSTETKAVVMKWSKFYRDHRAILSGDIIPLRRADGRSWDGLLHVRPGLDVPAMAMLYNPLDEALVARVRAPLYYSGLRGTVMVEGIGHVKLNDRHEAVFEIKLPPRSSTPITFKQEDK